MEEEGKNTPCRKVKTMNWFTGKKRIEDERIVQLQNVIYREMYGIVATLCILSIAVKFYMYGIDAKQVAIELIILFAQGFYYAGRAMSLGIISDEIEIHDRASSVPMSKKNVMIGLGTGSVLALIFGIRSAVTYGETISTQLWYFVLVFFCFIYDLCSVVCFRHYDFSLCGEEKRAKISRKGSG